MTFDYLPLRLRDPSTSRALVRPRGRNLLRLIPAILAITLFAMALAALASIAPAIAATATKGSSMTEQAAAHLHDFDYLVGKWNVSHHKLKARLAGSHDWIDFKGTSELNLILDGLGTFDENEIDQPDGAYKGVTIRTLDPKTGLWSVYWLDSRTPGVMDAAPLKGNFNGDVGTFYADDTFDGRPIRVRFIWTYERPNNAHWEQAFSADGGSTWETNWTMEFTRVR